METFNICMVSDFFFPRLGGIETHIYELSQALILRGLKVIVVTHFNGKRQGIRNMANGLKVYYIPSYPFVGPVTLPCPLTVTPVFRQILIRERIEIVHVHTTTSVLSSQCLFHAKTYNKKVIYTEHSLFSLEDASSIQVNGAQKNLLAEVDHIICVSYACKENLIARHKYMDPLRISAIPNAVDITQFQVDTDKRPKPPYINIIVLNRLTFRKGVDLLVQIIPRICLKYPLVNFIIGGDGAMRLILEEMQDLFELTQQVTILGAIDNCRVHNVLQMGHIFLNCSLSESFCIANLEAASCGLLVVSTNVGGVPEVLPPELCILAEPNVEMLTIALEKAIKIYNTVDPHAFHRKISESYSWNYVALKTQAVYNYVMKTPAHSQLERLFIAIQKGPIFGKLYSFLILLDCVWKSFWEFFHPEESIDICPNFDLAGFESEKRDLLSQ